MRNKLFSAEFQRAFPTIPDLYLVSAYTLWIAIASSVVISREAVRKYAKKKKRGFVTGRLVINSNNFCQDVSPSNTNFCKYDSRLPSHREAVLLRKPASSSSILSHMLRQ
jgi:hypothetical protein